MGVESLTDATVFDGWLAPVMPIPEMPGVDWNLPQQFQLMKAFAAYYPDLWFPEHAVSEPPTGYFYHNYYFAYSDAIFLYAFLRHFKPKRVLEIGAGFSSAVIEETNQRFFKGDIEHTIIDPNCTRLVELFGDQPTAYRFHETKLEALPADLFQALEPNDILFIDSSHSLSPGSDLYQLLFFSLPSLKPGVLVHFHDIFAKFDYPDYWQVPTWNEPYYLRAFLQYNRAFEILASTSLLVDYYTPFFAQQMPLCCKNPGGSLWLRKIA